MSGLRKAKIIEFRGQKVQVLELTVAQVDAFLAKQRSAGEAMRAYARERRTNPEAPEPVAEPPHALDLLMDSPLPVELLLQCVPELSEADLCGGEVSPSELEPLYRAAEEVNPFFLKLAQRILRAVPETMRADTPPVKH